MAISTIQPESCRVCGRDQRKVPKESSKCRLLQLLDLTASWIFVDMSDCYIDLLTHRVLCRSPSSMVLYNFVTLVWLIPLNLLDSLVMLFSIHHNVVKFVYAPTGSFWNR